MENAFGMAATAFWALCAAGVAWYLADVSDAALDREDELGKLVNSAFSLPPPPMPAFA